MGGFKTLALVFAASAAAVAGLSPARGQCRLCEKPTTALSQSVDGDGIELEIQTSLDFGRLILAGQGQGAVQGVGPGDVGEPGDLELQLRQRRLVEAGRDAAGWPGLGA